LQLDRIGQYRALLYFLVWRDFEVRHRQTALGVFGVVLQPLVNMAIFTVLFGYLLDMPSGQVPCPVFVYAGLLPWGHFASSLTRSSTSLVGNAHLISKVYFPRLIILISGVLAGLVELDSSFIALLAMMMIFAIRPTWAVI
jgi:lipopolysaccharide transport system permease protein